MNNTEYELVKAKLGSLTVIEAVKLSKDLEDAWGVIDPNRSRETHLQVTAYGAPMPIGYYRRGQQEYGIREIKYFLENVGDRRAEVMKILRHHFNLTLIQAKEYIDSPMKLLFTVDDYYDKDKGELLKNDLERAGATVYTMNINI